MPYVPLLDENGNAICDSQGYFIYVHSGGRIYKLQWMPGHGFTQNIRGKVNGYPVVFTAVAPMTLSEMEYSFDRGDSVEWYIETVGYTGSMVVSEHNSFIVPYPSG